MGWNAGPDAPAARADPQNEVEGSKKPRRRGGFAADRKKESPQVKEGFLVELRRVELLTSSLRTKRSTN